MLRIPPEEEDDADIFLEADYDALNNETFGEDIEEFDWEADHEQFSRLIELEKSKTDDEMNDLCVDTDWDNRLSLVGSKSYDEEEYVLFPNQKTFGNSSLDNLIDLTDDEFCSEKGFVPVPGLFNIPWLHGTNKESDEDTMGVGSNQHLKIESHENDFVMPEDFPGKGVLSYLMEEVPERLINESHRIPLQSLETYPTHCQRELQQVCKVPSLLHALPQIKAESLTHLSKQPEVRIISSNHSSQDLRQSTSTQPVQLLQHSEHIEHTYGKLFDSSITNTLQHNYGSSGTQFPLVKPNNHLHSNSDISYDSLKKYFDDRCNVSDSSAHSPRIPDISAEVSDAERKKAFFMFPPPQILHTIKSDYFKNVLATKDENFAAHDEFAGLMTDREKYWLSGIQLLPINGMDPYKDDYYFTVYQIRHNMSRKTHITKDLVRRNHSTVKDYTPLQFENSLGKVHVGSVTAPRKVIDTYDFEHVPNEHKYSLANTGQYNICHSQTWKTFLLKIENIYSKLLQYEDSRQPASKSKDQPTEEQRVEEKPDTIISDIYLQLTSSKEDFIIYMSIRKGRKLILRFLPYCENQIQIWNRVFESIEVLIERDKSDGLLLSYLPHLRLWLQSVSLNSLVQIAESFTYSLDAILTDIFGVSILASMVEHAEYVFLKSDKRNQILWMDFIAFLAHKLNSCTVVQRPVVYVKEQILFNHLSKCSKLKNGCISNLIGLFTNKL